MSVTIRDVAAKAGVSATVVSRVLHGKALTIRVSETTAQRVRDAAREMGYRKNVLATNFRERQTMMIGVLHGVGGGRPRFDAGSRYFASLMDGIVDGAFEHDMSVTLCPKLLGQSPEDAMSDGRFDGLIWYSDISIPENHLMIERCSVPLVLLHLPGTLFQNRFPTVCCDNQQGIGLAVDHLVSLGHRRIAFAYAPYSLAGEGFVRKRAFEVATQNAGNAIDHAMLIELSTDLSLIESILKSSERPTAIITWSEWPAARIMDLSVIGFDSTVYCESLSPKLTAIHQPLVNMGRKAVGLLVQSIHGEAPNPPDVILPCGLDIRESTTIAPKKVIKL